MSVKSISCLVLIGGLCFVLASGCATVSPTTQSEKNTVYAAELRCVKGNCINGTGTKNYAGGDHYEGQFKNGNRHGQGNYYFNSGDRYEGQYKDNKRNGQGTFYFVNGNRHEGEYKDDKKNGQGTFYFVNGDCHVGLYENGVKSGHGVSYFAKSGDRYEGQFRDDKYNGLGIWYSKDGTILLEGLWVNNKFITPTKVAAIDARGVSVVPGSVCRQR